MRISDWSSDVCSSDLIAPSSTAIDRPSVTVSAPYDLRSPSRTRIGSATAVPLPNHPAEAAARIQHDQDQQRAEADQTVPGVGGQHLLHCQHRKSTRLNSSNQCPTAKPSPA